MALAYRVSKLGLTTPPKASGPAYATYPVGCSRREFQRTADVADGAKKHRSLLTG